MYKLHSHASMPSWFMKKNFIIDDKCLLINEENLVKNFTLMYISEHKCTRVYS